MLDRAKDIDQEVSFPCGLREDLRIGGDEWVSNLIGYLQGSLQWSVQKKLQFLSINLFHFIDKEVRFRLEKKGLGRES